MVQEALRVPKSFVDIINKDLRLVTPDEEVEVLRGVINSKGGVAVAEDGTQYFFGGETLEEFRLGRQNSRKSPDWSPSWGEAHNEQHRKISSRFQPKSIAIIGSSAAAIQAQDVATSYPEAKIYVVELSPKKCEGARNSLNRTHPEDMKTGRIEIIDSDAIHALPQIAKTKGLDMVDLQNVLIHAIEGEDKIPLFWNPGKMGPFSTLERVLGVIEESLTKGGILNAGELAVWDWDAVADKGFERNEEVQETLRRLKSFMPIVLTAAWAARGANPWNRPEQVEEKIARYASSLKVLPDLSNEFRNPPTKAETDPGLISLHIPVITAAGAQNAIGLYERVLPEITDDATRALIKEKILPSLKENAGRLWVIAENFINLATKKGVLLQLPTLHYRVFKKD